MIGKSRKVQLGAWLCLGLVAVATVAAGVGVVSSCHLGGAGPVVRSRARMRVILNGLMEVKARDGSWPDCNGKNFVLATVAHGVVSTDDPRQIEALFSPNDRDFKWYSVDRARYREVTLERLVSGQDFHELTSYAGRRNATPGYKLTVGGSAPEPLIADLHFPGLILIGYSDGSVRRYGYEELGVPCGHEPPIPIGDDATSELLRKFSRD